MSDSRAEPGMLRSALALGAFAGLATLVLAVVHTVTSTRIEVNRQLALRQAVSEISGALPPVPLPRPLPPRFLVCDGKRPVVLLVTGVTRGYAGNIRFLAAVSPNGTVEGVRVIEHTETPGLGDAIEAGKSDWILGFAGRPVPKGATWALQSDGGDFDGLTGATITARAVVGGVAERLSHAATLPMTCEETSS